MIRSSVLIGKYSFSRVPRRYKIVDGELRPFQTIFEKGEEFEEMMLSLFLLDKFLHGEEKLCFETRHKKAWDNVKKDLEQLFLFLTERKLSIDIEESPQKQECRQERLIPDELVDVNHGTLCLFSGGLDSAAGALRLAKDKQSPTLSHTATGNITLGKVGSLQRDPLLMDLPLIITDMRTPRAYFSPTNTRGLLFLSNAMVLASSLRLKQVYLAENGPLMINPHVSPISVPTKNAHPYLILTIAKIYNLTTDSKPEIIPNFKDETKAEIIANIANYPSLVNNTWSCFKVQGQTKMCGICFACFVRRLSALAAGYQEPTSTYKYDPFKIELKDVGESLRTDIDILHDTLVYLKDLLNDDHLVEEEMFMIPSGFFQDPGELLRRFSLDVFLGLDNYKNKLNSSVFGPLGRFAIKILETIPSSELREREGQLNSLKKWDLEIRLKGP